MKTIIKISIVIPILFFGCSIFRTLDHIESMEIFYLPSNYHVEYTYLNEMDVVKHYRATHHVIINNDSISKYRKTLKNLPFKGMHDTLNSVDIRMVIYQHVPNGDTIKYFLYSNYYSTIMKGDSLFKINKDLYELLKRLPNPNSKFSYEF